MLEDITSIKFCRHFKIDSLLCAYYEVTPLKLKTLDYGNLYVEKDFNVKRITYNEHILRIKQEGVQGYCVEKTNTVHYWFDSKKVTFEDLLECLSYLISRLVVLDRDAILSYALLEQEGIEREQLKYSFVSLIAYKIAFKDLLPSL